MGLHSNFQEPVENVGHGAILGLLTENVQFNCHFNYPTDTDQVFEKKSFQEKLYFQKLKIGQEIQNRLHF